MLKNVTRISQDSQDVIARSEATKQSPQQAPALARRDLEMLLLLLLLRSWLSITALGQARSGPGIASLSLAMIRLRRSNDSQIPLRNSGLYNGLIKRSPVGWPASRTVKKSDRFA